MVLTHLDINFEANPTIVGSSSGAVERIQQATIELGNLIFMEIHYGHDDATKKKRKRMPHAWESGEVAIATPCELYVNKQQPTWFRMLEDKFEALRLKACTLYVGSTTTQCQPLHLSLTKSGLLLQYTALEGWADHCKER